jgi:hypothetical protein
MPSSCCADSCARVQSPFASHHNPVSAGPKSAEGSAAFSDSRNSFKVMARRVPPNASEEKEGYTIEGFRSHFVKPGKHRPIRRRTPRPFRSERHRPKHPHQPNWEYCPSEGSKYCRTIAYLYRSLLEMHVDCEVFLLLTPYGLCCMTIVVRFGKTFHSSRPINTGLTRTDKM